MVYTLSGVRFPTVPSLHKSPAFTSNADRRNPSVSVFSKKHYVSRTTFLCVCVYVCICVSSLCVCVFVFVFLWFVVIGEFFVVDITEGSNFLKFGSVIIDSGLGLKGPPIFLL